MNGELAWMYGVARVGMPVVATISFSALMIGEIGEVGVSEVSSAGVAWGEGALETPETPETPETLFVVEFEFASVEDFMRSMRAVWREMVRNTNDGDMLS